MAEAVHRRRIEAAVVSRRALQRNVHPCRWRNGVGARTRWNGQSETLLLERRGHVQLPGVLRLFLLRHLRCSLLWFVPSGSVLAGDREAGDARIRGHSRGEQSAEVSLDVA